MKNFKPNNREGFRSRNSERFRNSEDRSSMRPRGFRDRSRDNSFSRKQTEMHSATCDKCKKQCQVPFRPTGNKPVLCSDCFRKKESFGNNFDSKYKEKIEQSGISQEQFNQINTKLDKIIQVLNKLEICVEEDSEEENDI